MGKPIPNHEIKPYKIAIQIQITKLKFLSMRDLNRGSIGHGASVLITRPCCPTPGLKITLLKKLSFHQSDDYLRTVCDQKMIPQTYTILLT